MNAPKHRCLWIAMALLLFVGSTWAEEYVGRVTGENVNIRSGPNINSYAVTRVSAPQKVKVVDRVGRNWLAIEPIPGCVSVIAKKYVRVTRRDEYSRIGQVTGNGVRVWAAGPLRQKQFHAIQGTLNKDDAVRIIGEARDDQGQWYIIRPPKGAKFYISSDFISRVDAEEETTAAETDESEEETVVIEPVPEADSRSAPTVAVQEEVATLRKIKEIQNRLIAETQKPADQRKIEPILSEAQALDVPADSRFAGLHEQLIVFIRQEQQIVEKRRMADRLAEEALRPRRETDAEQVEIEIDAAPDDADLRGKLARSMLYPDRYVLRDPQTGDFKEYVTSRRPGELAMYEGKVVGIKGTPAFDRRMAMKVYEVDEIGLVQAPEAAVTQVTTTTPTETESVTVVEAPTPEEIDATPSSPETTTTPTETRQPEPVAVVEDSPDAPPTISETQPAEDAPTDMEPVDLTAATQPEETGTAEGEIESQQPADGGTAEVAVEPRPDGTGEAEVITARPDEAPVSVVVVPEEPQEQPDEPVAEVEGQPGQILEPDEQPAEPVEGETVAVEPEAPDFGEMQPQIIEGETPDEPAPETEPEEGPIAVTVPEEPAPEEAPVAEVDTTDPGAIVPPETEESPVAVRPDEPEPLPEEMIEVEEPAEDQPEEPAVTTVTPEADDTGPETIDPGAIEPTAMGELAAIEPEDITPSELDMAEESEEDVTPAAPQPDEATFPDPESTEPEPLDLPEVSGDGNFLVDQTAVTAEGVEVEWD